MAIQQVRVQINGAWHTLTYNSGNGRYEKSITAPNVTSYNVNAEHYYPVTVETTNTAGTVETVEVKATDSAGLTTTVTIDGTLDTSAPEVTSVTITPNPVDAGATMLISVAVTG